MVTLAALAAFIGLSTRVEAHSDSLTPKPFKTNSAKCRDYRNRSFDPATGRFLQRDPVLGGDPLYNPYGFPGANPVTGSDPMGDKWHYSEVPGKKQKEWHWVDEGDGPVPAHDPSLRDAVREGVIGSVNAMNGVVLSNKEALLILKSRGITVATADNLPEHMVEGAARKYPLLSPHARNQAWANRVNKTIARNEILISECPVIVDYVKSVYLMLRMANPVHYAFEKGYVIGSGEEPVLGEKESRLRATGELILYIGLIKGMNWVNARVQTLKPLTGEAATAAQRQAALQAEAEINDVLEQLGARERIAFKPAIPPNPGRPFVPGGPKIQKGVDPNSLTAGEQKVLFRENMDGVGDYYTRGLKPVKVNSQGVIYNGHHTARWAAEAGKTVDVVVGDEAVTSSGARVTDLPIIPGSKGGRQ